MASKDKTFVRSRLNITDLRQFVSQVQEQDEQFQNLSEEQQIDLFIEKFLDQVGICLFVNPELQSTDRLLTLTPPIKRTYNIVSTLVEKNAFRSTKPILSSLCPGLSPDQYKSMVTEVGQFYSKFLPREQFQYSFIYSKVLLIQNILENEWSVQLKDRSDQLKSGLSQLTSAQKEVDQLSKEAQQRHAVIQRAQKEANEALVQITAKMEMVS